MAPMMPQRQCSVPEMADSCCDQRNAILIATLHSVLVPHAASRVRDSCDASLACNLHGVVPREREECIAGQN